LRFTASIDIRRKKNDCGGTARRAPKEGNLNEPEFREITQGSL